MNLMGMKSENVAQFNNRLVLNLLLQAPLSCVELAEKSNLTHMTTGRILRRLYEMEVVKPYVEPQKKRNRGGQFFRYEINAERAYFICINFHHLYKSFSIYDLTGKTVYIEESEGEKVSNSVVDDIFGRINFVLDEKKIPFDRIAVVSIAIPGRINEETGEIIVSSKIDKSVNLTKRFKTAFPSSTIEIKNNIEYACINSILSDEFDYSKGTHLYLYVGSGVFCCLVYDKKIILGSNGFGGEIGMNCIDSNENRLSPVIETYEMQSFCRSITGNMDFELSSIKKASEEYPPIKNRLLEIADTLGRTIRNYIDFLGASHIIFAGPITQYPEFFFDEFLAKIKKTNYSDGIDYKIDYSFSEETGKGQILLSRLNALDWVMNWDWE
ncbi:MAG: ROK family protein [Clostridia bacterium]|nr:ROK family protein [Clostridia bacterium]